MARRRGRLSRESILYLSSSPRLLREDRPRGGNNRGGKSVRECKCKLEADLLTLCEEHKQELERLKANPPAWAIKARRGERA